MIYFETQKDQGSDDNILQVEKENPNLITVFICFLRSGLRFTRYDTNNVGLAFIEEIKKHNPNFKAEKVQQRERDQIYTVNAFPKEFEPLINSLIEEYRIKHKLEYRLKKPRSGGGRSGGYNRQGGNRQGGYNQSRDNRGTGYSGQRRDGQSQGSYSRPRRDDQGGGYNQRRDNSGTGDGSYNPRRSYDSQQGQGSYRPRRNYDDLPARENPRRSTDDQQSGYRPRRTNYDQPGHPTGGENRGARERTRPDDEQNFNRDGYVPRFTREKGDNDEEKRPRRPRKDTNE